MVYAATRVRFPRDTRAGHAIVGGALVLALAMPGCEDDARLEEAEAARRVAEHGQRFAALDRWARRLFAAEQVPRGRAALEETLFAPVRRQAELVAAWVKRPEREPLYLGVLDAPPEDASYRTVRHERLGELRVARVELPDRLGDTPDRIPCTLIVREQDDLTTAAAYREPE